MCNCLKKYSKSLLFLIVLFATACFSNKKNYDLVRTEVEQENILLYKLINDSNRELQNVDAYIALGLSNENEEDFGSYIHNTKQIFLNEKNTILYLPNVNTLTVDQAKAISSHARHIYLNGLQEITPEIAKILVDGLPISLHLNGLKNLDQKTAAEFTGLIGPATVLGLNGLSLSETTPQTITELQKIVGVSVLLNGIVQ